MVNDQKTRTCTTSKYVQTLHAVIVIDADGPWTERMTVLILTVYCLPETTPSVKFDFKGPETGTKTVFKTEGAFSVSENRTIYPEMLGATVASKTTSIFPTLLCPVMFSGGGGRSGWKNEDFNLCTLLASTACRRSLRSTLQTNA